MDLALNNPQRLICHKNPTNQPTNQPTWEAKILKMIVMGKICCYIDLFCREFDQDRGSRFVFCEKAKNV